MTGFHFFPRFSFIENITQDQNAVVTFPEDHDFTDGEIVSFRVSQEAGMKQINNKQARVLLHDALTITVELDTTSFDAFINVGEFVQNPSVVVPSCSGILPNFDPYLKTVTLADAFDNLRTT